MNIIVNRHLKSALLISICLVWIVFTTLNASHPTSPNETAVQTGFLAPDINLAALDGTNNELNNSNNMPIMVNFWASWCKPCQSEMPAIQKMYERYGDKIVFLSVNNTKQDSLPSILDFTNKNKLTFPVLLDKDGKVFQQFQISALPTTFFINRSGVIEDIVLGGPMSESLLEIRLLKLLELP